MSQPPSAADELKELSFARVDSLAEKLLAISHAIHENPELGYEEHFAHDLLSSAAEDADLDVQRSAYGLETAFAARAGSTGATLAILCEYDALPGIGHACGHNIIAAAGLGAGLAVAPLLEELNGRLLILGTPAEEGGGGKIHLINAGALEDVDAAMMLHPAGLELLSMTTLAVSQVTATYRGRASHAAAAPHKGRNALDAAVLGYMAVAALRQHITPEERIHGIFTLGGTKANVVPALVEMEWFARSPSSAGLAELELRLEACLRSGALAAGVELELNWDPFRYSEMISNPVLERLWEKNAAAAGRKPLPPSGDRSVVGSTDMGNVSALVPSIHPMIEVSPPEVAIHTEAFAECARAQAGDKAVLDGAKMLAGAAIDYWSDASVRSAAADAFATAGS